MIAGLPEPPHSTPHNLANDLPTDLVTDLTPALTPENNAAWNPFFEEWKLCLREHYRFVIETHDTLNEQSLITVLRDTGFSDTRIIEMRAEIQANAGITPDSPADSSINSPVTSLPDNKFDNGTDNRIPVTEAAATLSGTEAIADIAPLDMPAEVVTVAYPDEAASIRVDDNPVLEAVPTPEIIQPAAASTPVKPTKPAKKPEKKSVRGEQTSLF